MDVAKALRRAERSIRDGAAARTHRDHRRPPRARHGGGRRRRRERRKRERVREQEGTAETRRRFYCADARVFEKVRREEHALPRKALEMETDQGPFRAHRSRPRFLCVPRASPTRSSFVAPRSLLLSLAIDPRFGGGGRDDTMLCFVRERCQITSPVSGLLLSLAIDPRFDGGRGDAMLCFCKVALPDLLLLGGAPPSSFLPPPS